MQNTPERIDIIGNELAIAWPGSVEHYLEAPYLREHSPSAENVGEKDILGNHYGPDAPKRDKTVRIEGFERIGNYAIRIAFSDGHQTGLYSWDYLYRLGQQLSSER